MLDPVVLTPAHDFTLGDPQLLGRNDMFFAADGRFYAQSNQLVFNAWNFLAFYWPETLGVILALTLLLALTACERIRRRPRQVGALHCRRCNYNVSGLPAAAPCAECGADLSRHRPVLGRSLRRRLASPIGIALLASACYAGLHAAGVPRMNQARDFLHWPIPGAAALVHDCGLMWLEQFNQVRSLLVEVDPRTGGVVRSVCSLDARLPLSPSPDGRLVISTLARDKLVAIDLLSGRTVATVSTPYQVIVPKSGYATAGWSHVVGWLGDRVLLVQLVDDNTPRSTVHRWDIQSGELVEIADAPTARVTTPFPMVLAARLRLVPGTDPPLALEVPTRKEGEKKMYGAASTIRVREMLPGGKTVREVSGAFWPKCAPVPWTEAGGFFIGMQGEHNLGLWSLSDGAMIGGLTVPGLQDGSSDEFGGIAFHESSHRLFAIGQALGPFCVRVRDTRAKEWIAELTIPKGCRPHGPIIVSPDARFVAINVVEDLDESGGAEAIKAANAGKMLGFRRRLLIFDLSSLAPGQPKP